MTLLLGAGTMALLAPHRRFKNDVSTALLSYESYSSGDDPIYVGLLTRLSWLWKSRSASFLVDTTPFVILANDGICSTIIGAILSINGASLVNAPLAVL